ncbi:MAG: hypothetical protein ACOYLQ_01710 [Hyphomicrobiaceae bacterium]
MDVTLFAFVGDMLAALASGLGIVRAPRDDDEGFAIATRLLESDAPEAGRLVESAVRAICAAIAAEGVGADEAEAALADLGTIVKAFAGRPEVVASASTSAGEDNARSAAANLTLAVLTAAVNGAQWPQRLSPGLATSILESVLTVVLSNPRNLAILSLLSPPTSDPTPTPTPTPAEPLVAPLSPESSAMTTEVAPPPPAIEPLDEAVAAQTGIPAVGVAALRRVVAVRAPHPKLLAAILLERARALAALVARLAGPETGQDHSGRRGIEAAQAMRQGAFDAADRALSHAEDDHLRAAQSDMHNVTVHMGRATELRLARAELAAALGDFRRSARHMVSALRCLPAGERMGRWQFLMRQGALLKAAGREGDVAALREAATAFRSAAAEASAIDVAHAWAHALVEWAAAAIEIARAEDDPRVASEAADTLSQALAALPREGHDALWGLGQLRLGHAVLLSATGSPDVARLMSASEAYRAAMVALARDPRAAIEAQGWYGMTLVKLSLATGDRTTADKAIPHLEGALEDPEARLVFAESTTELAAALGDAAQSAGLRRGDLRLLETAAQAYRSALADLRAQGQTSGLGGLQEQLGACLWRLADSTRDPVLFQAAAEALQWAIVEAEQQGDTMRTGLLRGELERLATAARMVGGRADLAIAPV